jgi:hypothetical protein
MRTKGRRRPPKAEHILPVAAAVGPMMAIFGIGTPFYGEYIFAFIIYMRGYSHNGAMGRTITGVGS